MSPTFFFLPLHATDNSLLYLLLKVTRGLFIIYCYISDLFDINQVCSVELLSIFGSPISHTTMDGLKSEDTWGGDVAQH